MGWNLRRSVNVGPLRLNASKSGIGYSVGVRGFRVGKDAKSRKYVATSIPGTGIYRRDYLQKAPQPIPPSPVPRPNLIRPGIGFYAPVWLVYVVIALLLYLIIRIFS
jgi:hypothetical protein